MQGYKVRLELAVGRGKKDGATIFDSVVAFTMARWKKDVTGEAPTNTEQVLQGLLPLPSHIFKYSMVSTLSEEV